MLDDKILELLADELFVKWVKSNDSSLREHWSKWLQEHPEYEKEFKKAQQLVRSVNYEEKFKLNESENHQVLSKIERYLDSTDSGNSNLKYWIRGIAASVIMVFGLLYYFKYNEEDKLMNLQEPQLIEKTTAIGSKLTITLPDGSTVKLNSGSKLSYYSPFGLKNREVELEGEAFFEVMENPQKPFVVKSNALRTEVLGTSFNIKAYNDNSNLDIILVSGLVKVDFFDEQTRLEKILNPNEMISYSRITKKIKIEKVDPEAFICWKDHILKFSNESLSEVIHKLERWYGVDIVVNNPDNREWQYNGEFKRKSLEHVLLRMSFAEKFTYNINNDNVILHLK